MSIDVIYGWDEEGNIIIKRLEGSIKITPNNLYMINKYGNTLTIDETSMTYKQNSPTYDELYEHWLKTKQND